MKRFILILGLLALAKMPGYCLTPQPVALAFSTSASSVTAAAGIATVTISTPVATAYSTGVNTFVTHIHIEMYATGTLTGGATPVTCTTTNLPGNPVFKFQTAEATGTDQIIDLDFASPLMATNSALNTVVSCPSTASVIWNIVVNYYQAS